MGGKDKKSKKHQDKEENRSPKKHKSSFLDSLDFHSASKKLKLDKEAPQKVVEGSSPKKQKKDKEIVVPDSVAHDSAEEAAPSKEAKSSDINGWTPDEIRTLLQNIQTAATQQIKSMKCNLATNKIKWEKVKFGNHSAEDCLKMWNYIDEHQRKFRLFSEILTDAALWVDEPWKDFRKQSKVHPEMPKKPLGSYILFCQDKKDKILQENPTLSPNELMKVLGQRYQNLSEKKKKKYMDKAERLKEQYKEDLMKFYAEHPEVVPKESKEGGRSGRSSSGPFEKPKRPFQLYVAEKMKSVDQNNANFDKAALLEKYKRHWKKMSDEKKALWISQAKDIEEQFLKNVIEHNKKTGANLPVPSKTILSKDEVALLDKSRGKPLKPPASAYALYCSIRAQSVDFSNLDNLKRFNQFAKEWKDVPSIDKERLNDKLKALQAKYKENYEEYLKTLSPEEREKELEKEDVAKKSKRKSSKPDKPTVASKTVQTKLDETLLKMMNNSPRPKAQTFMGEPELPPENEYQLFCDVKRKENPNVASSKLTEMFLALSVEEKSSLTKKFKKMQKNYYDEYEQFLNRLDPETMKLYMQRKNQASAALYVDENSVNDVQPQQAKTSNIESEDSESDSSESEDDDEDEKDEGAKVPLQKQVTNNVSKKSSSDSSSEDEDDSDEESEQKTTTVLTQAIKKLESSSSSSSSSSDSD